MAKDKKFGTFGGVFTPSILTILGVIMYMRLPLVVGHAGFLGAMGIILVAHVVSFATGASVASIATDKTVGAGGPYYIISRSLGLPIGGTIGLGLFIGLSFSISLYVIGFSESFLSYWGWEVTPNNIRICGTITVVAITIVTLISTAFAIKTQYLILALIGLSLISIFGGTPGEQTTEGLMPPLEGGKAMGELFGIFFPAVTGFTAGVNMSGDLRDPKRSLPWGTLSAIAVGALVYFGLAGFFALRVPQEQLVDDPDVLLHIAWVPELVVAGIWGATISSALGSILGAPRILQALAVDRIMPHFFARGEGPTNEPRRALLLAFLLGEAGILIAELDTIARIVSMVFLTMYGVVNLSAAVESWVSPDFRPEFRVPRIVSIIGALTAALLMIQLDLPAMLGATAAMVGLFVWLQRRQLRLDSGDAWEGVWSSVIRTGLHRLSQEASVQRNWRPNILYFSPRGSELRAPTLELSSALISGRGIITDFEVVPKKEVAKDAAKHSGVRPMEAEVDEDLPVGIFRRPIPSSDIHRTVTGVAKYHGFSGLSPNTVLLDWLTFRDDGERFADLLQRVAELDLNILLYARDPKRDLGNKQAIDVWWRAGAGNLPLSLSLLRFITISRDWRDVEIRFLLVTQDASNVDVLQTTARRFLQENRIDAQLRVINNALGVKSFEDWVREESTPADLVIVGLPTRTEEIDADFLARADRLQADVGSVMFVRASSFFGEVLRSARAATASQSMASGDTFELELPPLELPPTPELSAAASRFADAHQKLVMAFHEQCVERIYAINNELLSHVRASVEKHFSMLEKGMVGTDARRQRKTVNRVQSAFLQEAKRRLTELFDEIIPEAHALLGRRLDAILEDQGVVDADAELISVSRDPADFRAQPEDKGRLRRFKRRRRLVAFLTRSRPSYRVPLADLQRYHVEAGVRDIVQATVGQLVTETHQLAIHVGKRLNGSRTSLALLGDGVPAEALEAFLAERKQEALDELDGIIEMNEQRVEQHRRSLLSGSRRLAQALCDDLKRVDVADLVQRERRPGRDRDGLHERLRAIPEAWQESQRLLYARARAGLAISELQHRLVSLAHRIRSTTTLAVRNGPLSVCEKLRADLEAIEGILEQDEPELPKLNYSFEEGFDPRPVVDNLVAEASRWVEDLPETVRTLDDETITAFEEGRMVEGGVIDLPVKQIVDYVVETELIGPLQEELGRIPTLEQRAVGIAQDVMRLVSFNRAEYESSVEAGDETELATHMGPVVKNGLERLRPELEQLQAITRRVNELIDRRLSLVLEHTNPYDLGEASGDVGGLRLRQGRRAVSGVRALVQRGAGRVRDGFVRLLYRRSAGQVLARRLRAEAGRGRSVVDRVLALVNQHSPRPEVLGALPFYYRQLFFGQSTVNEAFWVDREAELGQARQALTHHRRGSHGALIVIGDRNAGKTALCQRLAARQLANYTVYRIPPPPGGSIDPAVFRRSFESAVGVPGSWSAIFHALPDNAAIVINDVELWWERSPDGLAVVDQLLELIDQYAGRCLFLLELSTPAFDFINRFRPLGDKALTVIECGALPAELLKEIVSLRHASTGLRYSLDERAEAQLPPWTVARLFTGHFGYAGGNVGAALRSWVTHIDKVAGEELQIRQPQPRAWDVLDELKVDWIALLLQLVLHKQVSLERLTRITGLDALVLRRDLDTLLRMGLIRESRQHVIEMNRFVEHVVLEHFQRRGMLP